MLIVSSVIRLSSLGFQSTGVIFEPRSSVFELKRNQKDSASVTGQWQPRLEVELSTNETIQSQGT